MKKVFTILSILYSLTAKSQDSVYVSHKFTLDKVIKYEIIKGRFDSQKPEFADVESLTNLTSISRAKKKGLTETTFTYGETIVKDFDMSIIPDAQRNQMNIYKNAEIKLLTDPFGFYYGLSNFKKLQSFINNSYINIIKLSQPVELPNPFGGNSFAATNTTTIDEIKNGYAIISSNTIVNEESLNEGMKQILKSMSPTDEKIEELPTFNMINKIIYVFDLENSKILDIKTEKHITLPNKSRIDKLRIKEI